MDGSVHSLGSIGSRSSLVDSIAAKHSSPGGNGLQTTEIIPEEEDREGGTGGSPIAPAPLTRSSSLLLARPSRWRPAAKRSASRTRTQYTSSGASFRPAMSRREPARSPICVAARPWHGCASRVPQIHRRLRRIPRVVRTRRQRHGPHSTPALFADPEAGRDHPRSAEA